jgi:hypothetical protein
MKISIVTIVILAGTFALPQSNLANPTIYFGKEVKGLERAGGTLAARRRNPQHYPCQDYDPAKKTCGTLPGQLPKPRDG